MRFEFPASEVFDDRVEGVSIAHVTTSMNRDALGRVYRVSIKRDGMIAEVEATVGRSTSLYASAKALSEGLDYWSWPMAQARENCTEFAEKFGNYFVVRMFTIATESVGSIDAIRDVFIRGFFRYASSFQCNRSDYADGNDGFYPDRIEFIPYDLDRQHRLVVDVADVLPEGAVARS